jgi:diguanylate cyclase (GGDEF)-like protein
MIHLHLDMYGPQTGSVLTPSFDKRLKFTWKQTQEILQANKIPMPEEKDLSEAGRQALMDTAFELKSAQDAFELLLRQNTKLNNKLAIDPLTGLSAKTMFEESLGRTIVRRKLPDAIIKSRGRTQQPYPPATVVMFDVDSFKSINSVLGHKGADEALKHIANILREQTPKGDLVARSFDEDPNIVARNSAAADEFFVILHNANADQARDYINRVQTAIKQKDFTFGEKTIALSITGAAHEITERDTVESVLHDVSIKMLANKSQKPILGDHTARAAKNDAPRQLGE